MGKRKAAGGAGDGDAVKQKADNARPEFYGVEIVFNDDGTDAVTEHGGCAPRLLSPAELRPWLILADAIIDSEKSTRPAVKSKPPQ
jgi:hypothetical protein